MKYDGILFDLDGTLWNSTKQLAASWAIALESEPDVKRPPTSEELEGVMGMTSEALMAKLFPELSPERAQEIFEHCCEVELDYLLKHGGNLYTGLIETLELLSKNHPLFIVSNCNFGYIEAFLDAHKLRHYFKDWECIGRTGLQKWENIKLIEKRNGLFDPVYVGDTIMDFDASQKAGLPFIHAAYGFGKVDDVQYISSISELPKLV